METFHNRKWKMQRICKEIFGEHEGRTVHLFRLTNANGMTAELIEFGGRIKGLSIPDGKGGLDNMSMGFETLEPYAARFNPWFGALVGRTASRITGASFELDGVRYNLSANGPGGSLMHGGYKGFDKVIWTGEAEEDGDGATLKLRYTAADGEEGYPGRVDVLVTYRLDDENRFHMNWEAVTDKPTIIDMTSHVYLNLNGFRNENVMNEYLRVNASEYLEKDDTGTPTGTLFSVEGTPFDLRKAMPLDKLSNGGVYNPILNWTAKPEPCARWPKFPFRKRDAPTSCSPQAAPFRCTTPITCRSSSPATDLNRPTAMRPVCVLNRRTIPMR